MSAFGFLLTQESIMGVQTTPSPAQQALIDSYRAAYKIAHGFRAHGLHYIASLPAPVWLPPAPDSPFIENG